VRDFIEKWKANLPGVAASLTTASILFLASLAFAPVRSWLFPGKAANYPIFCTADPVAGEGGRRIVEFYIVNHSDKGFSGAELQKTLDGALQGTGLSGRAVIELPFDGVEGRIEKAYPDTAFNNGKGQLGVAASASGVRLTIGQIDSASILRAIIVFADMPDLGPIPRDAKALAIPFRLADLEEACYTRG
jgi:hypothetical protein